MAIIDVCELTKDYGQGRGIYGVTIEVKKGETLGFLGPNGAGKSTTMRHLMGFSGPEAGDARILGMDCRDEYAKILKSVGYLPGEVALPEGLDGKGFVKMMAGLRKGSSQARLNELAEIFASDLKQKVKKMSIGEKRKLAIIAAFMSDPEVLLLDEPTSGLDPMMQERFIKFIQAEKKRGKTILLSSHIFSEVEVLCDRIAIIKDGKIVSVVNAADIKHGLRTVMHITFGNRSDYRNFLNHGFELVDTNESELIAAVTLADRDFNEFINEIVKYDVKSFEEDSMTLEEYFMDFYKSDKKFKGVSNGKNYRN